MSLNTNVQTSAQLAMLSEKYKLEGKEMSSYLEKLIQEKNLDYTDYLNLDTLLTLQKSRTDQPDEMIFIVYHQIVELYFRLIIWELKQLTDLGEEKPIEGEVFFQKISRVNRYLSYLVDSFSIVLDGLDKEQFQQFRFALFPASGFQSYQYRLIEFYLSDMENLVSRKSLEAMPEERDWVDLYDQLYWKKSMINPKTQKKSPTLEDFEKRYDEVLLQHARAYKDKNVWQVFERYLIMDSLADPIIGAMRSLDELLNVQWTGMHYKVAMKHLTSLKKAPIKSTGGTSWGKYLHPRYQRITFFPKLYRKEEMEERAWPV